MKNGGYRSFDIVVYNLILFYHGYIWESIEILTNASHMTLEKPRRSRNFFAHCPVSHEKSSKKTKVDRISGQKGVQDAGGNRNGTTGRKYTQTQRWSVGRPLYQSAYIGRQNPMGLRLRHSLCRGQASTNPEKGRSGFLQLEKN